MNFLELIAALATYVLPSELGKPTKVYVRVIHRDKNDCLSWQQIAPINSHLTNMVIDGKDCIAINVEFLKLKKTDDYGNPI